MSLNEETNIVKTEENEQLEHLVNEVQSEPVIITEVELPSVSTQPETVDDIKTLATVVMSLVFATTDEVDTNVKVSPEVKSVLTRLMESQDYFDKVEVHLKDIIKDNKLDIKDVPKVMLMFTELYSVLTEKRIVFDENLCGELVKTLFEVALKSDIISVDTEDVETITNLYQIIDTSVKLLQTKSGGNSNGLFAYICKLFKCKSSVKRFA